MIIYVPPLHWQQCLVSSNISLPSLHPLSFHEMIFILVPPILISRLFSGKIHTEKVEPQMKEEISVSEFITIDDSKGISLDCGGVPCVFEFLTYKFVPEPGKLC